MKQKPPAFQFYPKQWLGDDKLMLMDWDARGMHIHLICISWQQAQPGTIPNDETSIRRWLKNPSQKVWKRVWPQIRSAWQIWGKNNHFLYSRGVLREFAKIKAFSRLQKEKAKLSWVSRRKINDATASATAMPRHHSGNARAGNALQSSSSPPGEEERKEKKEERLARTAPLGGASATRENGTAKATAPVVRIENDEVQQLTHEDFLKMGWRSSMEPIDTFEWDHLERTLSQQERVQSKMRERFYMETHAIPGGVDDVF